jgi:hypothetical protein
MPICFAEHNVCFFPIPKTASTSIKVMLFPQEAKNGKPLHKDNPAVNFNKTRHTQFKNWKKLAVVRDPIERVISCYRNKIVNAHQLFIDFSILRNFNMLSENPTFDEFVEKIELYSVASRAVKHHIQPTTFFLGSDSKYFTRLYKISEIAQLRADLTVWLNRPVIEVHRNKTTTKTPPIIVTPNAIDKLKKIYKQDYDSFEFDLPAFSLINGGVQM